jgi:lycopene beta-cyclase
MKSVLKPSVKIVHSSAKVRSLREGMSRAYLSLGFSWWKWLLLSWVIFMIITPLFPTAFATFSYASTLTLAIAVFGYVLETYGRKAWLLFVVAFGFGVAVEWLGKTTGFPFGGYHYTAPGPNILGVPLLVPLGWWAFSMIALLIPSRLKLWLAPLALVVWDLGLDPLMVQQGFWSFNPKGIYFGVPLSNFLGWYISGFILVYLLMWLEPRLKQDTSPTLRFAFGVQAFLMGVGLAVFFDRPLAGFVTACAMGLYLLVACNLEDKRELQKV